MTIRMHVLLIVYSRLQAHKLKSKIFQIRLGRPFGVAMLFAGVDHTGPHLFHLDPSGTYIRCLAKAIGAGADGAEQALRERCLDCDKVNFMRMNIAIKGMGSMVYVYFSIRYKSCGFLYFKHAFYSLQFPFKSD